jgi:hypothetical protein
MMDFLQLGTRCVEDVDVTLAQAVEHSLSYSF